MRGPDAIPNSVEVVVPLNWSDECAGGDSGEADATATDINGERQCAGLCDGSEVLVLDVLLVVVHSPGASVVCTPHTLVSDGHQYSGGIVLSDIQQTVLTNLGYFYLRVPSCRAQTNSYLSDLHQYMCAIMLSIEREWDPVLGISWIHASWLIHGQRTHQRRHGSTQR